MPTPFVVEDLFELNPESEMTYHDNFMCIDNYYKNIEEIQKVFSTMHVESWKMSKWSRNFRDYYDCRPCFANWEPDEDKINARMEPMNQLIGRELGINDIAIERNLSFNVFKHNKTGLTEKMQHHPHYDTDMVNVLVYLDEHSENGGTALYENVDIVNKEASNLIIDVSKYDIKEIIPGKPNRCVIFNGNQLHGAYIKNNDIYYDNWRITQATIIKNARAMMELQGDV
tara:strand:- start:3926 stop:4609 length:684 start_codon:yes stop_codon:yes gene_type:complete